MSVPPNGPQWARPPQPGQEPHRGPQLRPGERGVPTPPPAPRPAPGQGQPPGPAVPSDGRGGASQQRSDQQWQRPQGGPSAQQQPQQPGQMLGDDKVADAAKAAQKHSRNRIIDTSQGREDGLNKCPKCGGSDIHYAVETRSLVCGYCRHQWNEVVAEQAFGLDSSIAELQGHHMASGTADVQEDLTVITLKCQGCGAEVVLNVEQQLQQRCHWCRQTLSINSQIPNGAIPDAVLPFLLTRDQAVERIAEFAGARKTFAHPRFKQEFVPDNVMGVYIPYLVVDGNMHAVIKGKGEVTTRQYTVTVGSGKNARRETRYDADVYNIARGFDLLVDDLAVESATRFDAHDNSAATNNILHAVQPYDTENAVAYNSNYLKNFTSERRDLDIRDVDDRVEENFLSIARAKARPTIAKYDRGVQWQEEGVAVHGTRWVSVYVPVWLYSYADSAKGDGSLVHYIAVNARNGNTMGSVPVSHPKIFALSACLGGIAAAIGAAVGFGWFFASM